MVVPTEEGPSRNEFVTELQKTFLAVEAHCKMLESNPKAVEAYNYAVRNDDRETNPLCSTRMEVANLLITPYRDFLKAAESNQPLGELYPPYKRCGSVKYVNSNMGCSHDAIDAFIKGARRLYQFDVAQQIKKLLVEEKAAICGDSVLIPRLSASDALIDSLYSTGMIASTHAGLVTIRHDYFNYALGYDYVDRSQRHVMRASSSGKPSPLEWWKDDFNIAEFARSLTTYTPPEHVDEDTLADLEKRLKTSHSPTAKQYINDPALAKENGINDVGKLEALVNHLEAVCHKANVPVPQIVIGGFTDCAEYKRISIPKDSLNYYSLRALKAAQTHELAHVILNHALEGSPSPRFGLSPKARAFWLQSEHDADLLGIALNKDPLGLVEYFTASQKNPSKFSTQTSAAFAAEDTELPDSIPGDYHPSTRLRAHKCKEMEEARISAEKSR